MKNIQIAGWTICEETDPYLLSYGLKVKMVNEDRVKSFHTVVEALDELEEIVGHPVFQLSVEDEAVVTDKENFGEVVRIAQKRIHHDRRYYATWPNGVIYHESKLFA